MLCFCAIFNLGVFQNFSLKTGIIYDKTRIGLAFNQIGGRLFRLFDGHHLFYNDKFGLGLGFRAAETGCSDSQHNRSVTMPGIQPAPYDPRCESGNRNSEQ